MKLEEIRKKIDLIDEKMLRLLAQRFKLAEKTKRVKALLALPSKDSYREQEILERTRKKANQLKLKSNFVTCLFKQIIKESKRLQNEG